jgi:hypothetical protein
MAHKWSKWTAKDEAALMRGVAKLEGFVNLADSSFDSRSQNSRNRRENGYFRNLARMVRTKSADQCKAKLQKLKAKFQASPELLELDIEKYIEEVLANSDDANESIELSKNLENDRTSHRIAKKSKVDSRVCNCAEFSPHNRKLGETSNRREVRTKDSPCGLGLDISTEFLMKEEGRSHIYSQEGLLDSPCRLIRISNFELRSRPCLQKIDILWTKMNMAINTAVEDLSDTALKFELDSQIDIIRRQMDDFLADLNSKVECAGDRQRPGSKISPIF